MKATYRRAVVTASVTALAMAALTGCLDSKDEPKSPAAAASSPSAPPTSEPTAGPTASQANASLPDVCVLLNKEEASALLKKPVSTLTPDNKATENGCDYDESLSVTVSATTQAEFDSAAEGYPKVNGVGDGACTVSGVLWVRHGTTKITVIAGVGDGGRVAIARKVMAKLDAAPTTQS